MPSTEADKPSAPLLTTTYELFWFVNESSPGKLRVKHCRIFPLLCAVKMGYSDPKCSTYSVYELICLFLDDGEEGVGLGATVQNTLCPTGGGRDT